MVVAVVMGLTCSGCAEETERKYPFPTVPRSILERLGEMQLGEPPAIDPAEWKSLEDAWTRRDSLDAEKQTPEYDQLVVKLMLAASGVVTEEAQAPYLRKLETLIAGARVAADKGKPETHPGDSLMKFLHGGVMHGGYEFGQSSFASVFDTGIYNCVSSTAMYYVIGRELDLEMQIISIPGGSFLSGHACLNLVDGERTNSNPRTRMVLTGEPSLASLASSRSGFSPIAKMDISLTASGWLQPSIRTEELTHRKPRALIELPLQALA